MQGKKINWLFSLAQKTMRFDLKLLELKKTCNIQHVIYNIEHAILLMGDGSTEHDHANHVVLSLISGYVLKR